MRALRAQLIESYFSLDPRSLGLFRIVFGVVLLLHLYRRFLQVDYWYTETGLLPGSAMQYMRSLFLLASTHGQAVLGMTICAVAFVAFTVGFKTRIAQVASFVCVISLNNRVGVLENGGDIVVNLLALWTMFLPLGRRFSVDAARADRGPEAPVRSLAVLALLLQFAVIYLFNVLNKTGDTWSEGSAVYYALHQDRFTTSFAVWLRDVLPYSVMQAATSATLILESAAVVLILAPLWRRHLRLLAILLLPVLHLGFQLCLELGSFSYAMMSFFVLMLTREHWDGLARRWPVLVAAPETDPVPWRRHPLVSRVRILLREALILLLLVAAFGELRHNPTWPEALKLESLRILSPPMQYARLFQRWNMFAPDAPQSARTLVVEAVTADGRTVDPYNAVASPAVPQPFDPRAFTRTFFESGFPRMGQGQLFAAYSERISGEAWASFLPPLRRWILDYPKRTGNPQDTIVRFKVSQLLDHTPPPGETARQRKRDILMEYPD